MKKIIDTTESMEQFFNLPPKAQFLYSSYELFAIKIDNECAAFLNYEGKFVIAKAYKNCLSLGSRSVREFNSLADTVESRKTILEQI